MCQRNCSNPTVKPVKLVGRAETMDNANQYEIGFVSTLMPTSQPAKPGNPNPREPADWPVHMFYAFDTENGRGRAAMHPESWYAGEAGAMAGSMFVARKKNKTRLVFCGQIVPVDISISKHGQLGASEQERVVPEEVDIAVRRLSFMRFGIATHKILEQEIEMLPWWHGGMVHGADYGTRCCCWAK